MDYLLGRAECDGYRFLCDGYSQAQERRCHAREVVGRCVCVVFGGRPRLAASFISLARTFRNGLALAQSRLPDEHRCLLLRCGHGVGIPRCPLVTQSGHQTLQKEIGL